ncbi:16 kDa beta-galactoside-binding lectin-like [Zootoca vivipara]|uniref:16 kDa beta-galactoside-binding lectin-like n=1 Tax=Zootoca vivipara TaxID=8524 RepID=UPI0015922B67|nr:16 kDa beta-galactoside-binding lectin-like [Zootoca vivipara]
MDCKLTVTEFELDHGDTIQVRGKTLPYPNEFCVNLGEDSDNLVLRFNSRFDNHKDTSTIICMSKRDGVWEKEERITDFPFNQSRKLKFSCTFSPYEILVQLADNPNTIFPKWLDMKNIKYIAVEGNVKIEALRFLRLC